MIFGFWLVGFWQFGAGSKGYISAAIFSIWALFFLVLFLGREDV
jgi:hypothetical protein